MTAKVQEMLDDIVWGPCELQEVHEKTKRILDTHVRSMICVRKVLDDLYEWASKQSAKHSDTVSKILHIHIELFIIRTEQKTGIDAEGISTLFHHHTRISERYSAVSLGIL